MAGNKIIKQQWDGELKAMPVKAFGLQFGKDASWVRRLIHQGKIKAITGFGEILIPATETDVILDSIADDLDSINREGGLS
ncbi:hypothetical protein OAF65_10950 [Verrucomicrobiales bacterium]|jgi:hypothetical protein|nr:hypothetical protein [Verrucomicrobiales bacterium]